MSIVTIGEPAWLQLTPETALEPALPICDPHHHIWAHRHEPPAYQRYLLPDLAADIRDSGHNVHSTVFIEVRAQWHYLKPAAMCACCCLSSRARRTWRGLVSRG